MYNFSVICNFYLSSINPVLSTLALIMQGENIDISKILVL